LRSQIGRFIYWKPVAERMQHRLAECPGHC
jgi:hypothetical protein